MSLISMYKQCDEELVIFCENFIRTIYYFSPHMQVPSFELGTPRHASLDVGSVEDLIQRLQQEENIYVQADILNHLHNTW